MPVAYVAVPVCPDEVVGRPYEFDCRLEFLDVLCLLEELPTLLGSEFILIEGGV